MRLIAVAKELKLEQEMKRHWRIQKKKTQTRNDLERERKNLDGICGWKLIFLSLYVIPLHSYGSIIK